MQDANATVDQFNRKKTVSISNSVEFRPENYRSTALLRTKFNQECQIVNNRKRPRVIKFF